MTNEQIQKAEKGNRITGRKASAESYIPFYEFLLFDPNYRSMKDKAKILYSFLRKKTTDNKKRYSDYLDAVDNGEEPERGTASYLDENNEIFCLADNAELSTILQCHPNRVKDQRDELKRYGLLEEVPRFNKEGHKLSSKWYVLEPPTESLSERWTHIQEMKELREKIREENQKKKEKYLAKKKAEKSDDIKGSNPNKQNVSQTNKQNVSCTNQQNVSKDQSFIHNSTFNSLNILIQSIKEEIENTSLPGAIKNTLLHRMERLNEFKIKISDIELHFNSVKDSIGEEEYNFVLSSLIDKMTDSPKSFSAVMNHWLKGNREHQSFSDSKKKPTRKEVTPEWLKENEDQQEQPGKKEKSPEEMEQERRQMEEVLAKLEKLNAL